MTTRDHAGTSNTHLGSGALASVTTGEGNSAVGSNALGGVAIGGSALRRNVSGANTIAIGFQAGNDNLTGDRNVYIANAGADGESGVIRIGTEGVHTTTVLSGRVEGNIVAVYQ